MQFNLAQTNIILEDERVLLRPLVVEDFDLLLPFSLNEPELWTYSLLPADGPENLKAYLTHALEDRAANRAYPFLVFDKAKNQVAGSTRFYDYQPTHNTVLLGYTWYGKAFQGTGLNAHCKYVMLTHAFEVLELDRVEFRADNKNQRSIAAMKRIGCVPEGVLRSNCNSPSGRRDSIVLSILKEEWFGGKKEALSLLL
jgi:RimJ/RimL family protein N-acetyltransferase